MHNEPDIIELDGRKVRLLERHKINPDYSTAKQQVFIIGSKGIPANYGGFETFVEKLTEYQASNSIRYHVARMGDKDFRFEYNNAKCFNLRVLDIGAAKAIHYDLRALQWCIDYCKARSAIKHPIFFVLACRIGPFIRYYKRKITKLGGVLYVNPDGHEWKRQKWNAAIRKYWKLSERFMVKYADLMICDSKNIEKYIQKEYGQYHPKTTFIAYGSDTVRSTLSNDNQQFVKWYREKELMINEYYLVVGRFVPENNFETMIREFMKSTSKKSLAIITTIDNVFLEELERKLHFRQDRRIKFVGTVYDQELLKKIRESAFAYIHGHEVGGTNPSLLEALGSTNLNLLLDVGFNHEVAENGALYWTKQSGDLSLLINHADELGEAEISELAQKAQFRIAESYSWEYICGRYSQLFTQQLI